MLSFYESAQLRIRGETILDEAFAFTKTKLKSQETILQGSLAEQVKHALETPLHRGHPMFEARQYLSLYEEEISRYDSLLTLAKLHFNYLQLLHKEELQIVSKWWKDMQSQVDTSYARDRVPESYMWALTLYFEPCYSEARIIMTKLWQLLTVVNEVFDAHATIEEMRVLSHAINRWDIAAMSQLPEYFKPFYKFLLNEYAEWNKQIPQQGAINLIRASKKDVQELTTAYLQKFEWRQRKEVPSFEEFLKNGLVTSGIDLLYKSALICISKNVTQEAIAWYKTPPEILTATKIIGRFQDDLVTVEFERERASSVTSIDAYVKTYGVSENEAIEVMKSTIEDKWKDINEGWLKQREVPMGIVAPLVNIARSVDVFYGKKDCLTYPENTFKEYITLLIFVSVPIQ